MCDFYPLECQNGISRTKQWNPHTTIKTLADGQCVYLRFLHMLHKKIYKTNSGYENPIFLYAKSHTGRPPAF